MQDGDWLSSLFMVWLLPMLLLAGSGCSCSVA